MPRPILLAFLLLASGCLDSVEPDDSPPVQVFDLHACRLTLRSTGDVELLCDEPTPNLPTRRSIERCELNLDESGRVAVRCYAVDS